MDILKQMFMLEDKVVVIPGGTGVLGSAIARGMGQANATVIVCDRKNTQETAEVLSKEGIDAHGYPIDVLDIKKIQKTHDQILKKFGKVDILLNAAGGNAKDATTSSELSFFDLPLPALEQVVALNLFGGAILPAQVFGKSMVKNKNGGSIINISSMNAFRPLTRIPGYSAAKAAVSNFTQWLAVHFAQEYNENVRVNAIAPGFFLTAQNKFLLLDEKGKFTKRGKQIIEHTPMGRFGNPDDLLGVCLWLASDASKFVTGTVTPIDGGFSSYAGV